MKTKPCERCKEFMTGNVITLAHNKLSLCMICHVKLRDVLGIQAKSAGSLSTDQYVELLPIYTDPKKQIRVGERGKFTGQTSRNDKHGHVMVEIRLDSGNCVNWHPGYIKLLTSYSAPVKEKVAKKKKKKRMGGRTVKVDDWVKIQPGQNECCRRDYDKIVQVKELTNGDKSFMRQDSSCFYDATTAIILPRVGDRIRFIDSNISDFDDYDFDEDYEGYVGQLLDIIGDRNCSCPVAHMEDDIGDEYDWPLEDTERAQAR